MQILEKEQDRSLAGERGQGSRDRVEEEESTLLSRVKRMGAGAFVRWAGLRRQDAQLRGAGRQFCAFLSKGIFCRHLPKNLGPKPESGHALALTGLGAKDQGAAHVGFVGKHLRQASLSDTRPTLDHSDPALAAQRGFEAGT